MIFVGPFKISALPFKRGIIDCTAKIGFFCIVFKFKSNRDIKEGEELLENYNSYDEWEKIS